MTPRGVRFSRAAPFVKQREFRVQPASHSPSPFTAQNSHGKSPIVSPDRDFKPAISRPYYSTLIPRGIRGDRKTRDKPITHPSRKNKPENIPGQEEDLENKFVYLLQKPRPRERALSENPRGHSALQNAVSDWARSGSIRGRSCLSGFFFCFQSHVLFVLDLFLFYLLVEVAPVAAGDD